MSGEVFIAGHSLGAARAYEYAYSRVMRGLRVDGIYALAPPNPGCAAIGAALAHVPVVTAVKNGRDLVPDVPVDIELLGEQYVQPRPFVEIHEPPAPGDVDFLARWHRTGLYVAGVHKLQATGAAIELAPAADLVARLYLDADDWDWINPVNGAWWAMRRMPSGARLMIARGSATLLDWLDDFDATMVDVMGARMSAGFWAGIEPVQDMLDAQLV